MPHLHLSLRNDDGEPREIISKPLTDPEALDLLRSAEIAGSQLVPWGSNYTFAVLLTSAQGSEHLAIYKPQAGEAPLYDFPDGTLYRREVASVCQQLLAGSAHHEVTTGTFHMSEYFTGQQAPLVEDAGARCWVDGSGHETALAALDDFCSPQGSARHDWPCYGFLLG